jgi:hypothetical protein
MSSVTEPEIKVPNILHLTQQHRLEPIFKPKIGPSFSTPVTDYGTC